MPADSNVWEVARGWLTLVAAGTSALFAGLVWQITRSRLSDSYRLIVDTSGKGLGRIGLSCIVKNGGQRNLTFEAISVRLPWSLIVDKNLRGVYGLQTSPQVLEAQGKRVQEAPYPHVVQPGETFSFGVVVERGGGLKDAKSVAMWVHVLRGFPVIHHRKPRLRAILPASIRNVKR